MVLKLGLEYLLTETQYSCLVSTCGEAGAKGWSPSVGFNQIGILGEFHQFGPLAYLKCFIMSVSIPIYLVSFFVVPNNLF